MSIFGCSILLSRCVAIVAFHTCNCNAPVRPPYPSSWDNGSTRRSSKNRAVSSWQIDSPPKICSSAASLAVWPLKQNRSLNLEGHFPLVREDIFLCYSWASPRQLSPIHLVISYVGLPTLVPGFTGGSAPGPDDRCSAARCRHDTAVATSRILLLHFGLTHPSHIRSQEL